jgi:hypothetical protein
VRKKSGKIFEGIIHKQSSMILNGGFAAILKTIVLDLLTFPKKVYPYDDR